MTSALASNANERADERPLSMTSVGISPAHYDHFRAAARAGQRLLNWASSPGPCGRRRHHWRHSVASSLPFQGMAFEHLAGEGPMS